MDKYSTQPLKGFRDFLPEEAAERQEILEKIRSIFERYGFLPLETPALEYKEILTGKYGADADKLLYSFKDQGKRDVALRYDLTVPLARVVAQYQNELAMPFKRYQIAPVWRADRPQKGRFREFTQCDVDVVGTTSLFADAEVIACICQVLQELGLSDVIVRINNRKVLDGLMKEAGISADKVVEAIRAIDKLEKIGEDGVRGELASIGIQTKQANSLLELLGLGLESPDDIERKLEGIAGAGELAELLEILLTMGVKNFEVNLTLARGLDYYTGTIFEFMLPDASQFGSVAGGGRYDNLIGMFAGKQIPAVGCSIGIDRLLSALEELELVKYDNVFDVLVCNLDEAFTEKYLKIVQELRGAGIKTDFYYEQAKLDKQFKYANKKNINFAVIIGPDEAETGEATVKNMATGKQEKVKQTALVKYLKQK
jgi:histidyl-tRNA synthetase